jgi:DNA mismatch repair protein MutS2
VSHFFRFDFKTKNIPQSSQKHKASYEHTSLHTGIEEKAKQFSLQLDLRGMHVDEASQALESYLDDAILLRIHEVRILHGKGNGVLRNITRNILAKHTYVVDFYDERLELGGHGITLVKLR